MFGKSALRHNGFHGKDNEKYRNLQMLKPSSHGGSIPCPSWVTSGRFEPTRKMSVLLPKAAAFLNGAESPECARMRHAQIVT